MDILVTVCGRAGSKGVKNKNIREFLGNPLINYTLGAAKLFANKNDKYNVDICVNSDSKELLEIATSFDGVIGIERPACLAQDNSPKIPVIQHSLKYMEEKLNKVYDYVIDLDITSPLRTVEDIQNAFIKIIDHSDIDVVFSVVESRRNPYFNMVEEKDGDIRKIKESNFVARQQAPKVYDMNASIYCYMRNSLLNKFERTPFDGKCDIVLMKDTAVLDIDSEEDFELMEILSRYFFMSEYKEIYDYVKNLK
ncbi:MAG: acylneuraminate cytidylyltransferase family protein [Anaeromicrobium sp.]|jgi:CMP-N,N'-diacetyllegionaminic acid synthase|uniref:acylneuraminate cytidylyltransferase family protein n=1 Tax=Anaeromicrobium sp. TaxID=1929132 RepID=UPI0025E1B028|nr:acylneuraminate cytidylyltransferase family protein [Anaeromicrobium sp.]MCT4593967.1 acylneuraminate cytidylyltransferase family protein [Anaeromicrobium sp.]